MVDILLATCNGAEFIADQLDSLLAQTCQDFRVLVSDDASTDSTLDILSDYRERFGPRMVLLDPVDHRQGVVKNFGRLMTASLVENRAAWVMFCDQDDVWMPTKVARFLDVAVRLAASGDSQVLPCAIYSDLKVVAKDLTPLANSYFAYSRTVPELEAPLGLFSMNVMTGCAQMVNRRLVQLAVPLPDVVIMHDWWCALLSLSGRSVFIEAPLTLYRQHGGNQLGAIPRGLAPSFKRFFRGPRALVQRIRTLGEKTYLQADALRSRLELHGLDLTQVQKYLQWRDLGRWRRVPTYRHVYPGGELERLSRWLFWHGLGLPNYGHTRSARLES